MNLAVDNPVVDSLFEEPDCAKEVTAQRWVKTVNYHAGIGLWDLAVCRDPHGLQKLLAERERLESS